MADEKDKAQEKRRFEEEKEKAGVSLNEGGGMSGGASGAGKSGATDLQSNTPEESADVREEVSGN